MCETERLLWCQIAVTVSVCHFYKLTKHSENKVTFTDKHPGWLAGTGEHIVSKPSLKQHRPHQTEELNFSTYNAADCFWKLIYHWMKCKEIILFITECVWWSSTKTKKFSIIIIRYFVNSIAGYVVAVPRDLVFMFCFFLFKV